MLSPCLLSLSPSLFFLPPFEDVFQAINKETQRIPPTILKLLVQSKISRIWSLCSDPTVLRPPGNTWGLYGGVQSNTWGLYGTRSPTWVRHILGCIVLPYSLSLFSFLSLAPFSLSFFLPLSVLTFFLHWLPQIPIWWHWPSCLPLEHLWLHWAYLGHRSIIASLNILHIVTPTKSFMLHTVAYSHDLRIGRWMCWRRGYFSPQKYCRGEMTGARGKERNEGYSVGKMVQYFPATHPPQELIWMRSRIGLRIVRRWFVDLTARRPEWKWGRKRSRENLLGTIWNSGEMT